MVSEDTAANAPSHDARVSRGRREEKKQTIIDNIADSSGETVGIRRRTKSFVLHCGTRKPLRRAHTAVKERSREVRIS